MFVFSLAFVLVEVIAHWMTLILIPCRTGRGRRGEVHVPAVPEGVQLREWREVSHQQDTLPGESQTQKFCQQ